MTHRPAREVLGLRFDRLSPVALAALALTLAALWLFGRRYGGIKQDATIYLAQGLRRLDPGLFDKDLFFAYGSQDAFTAFPALYAPLIQFLGIGGAAQLVTVAGQIAFVAASWALVRRIVPGPARWWSLALLASISGYYGGVGVIRLAEPFATARSLAEPMVLVALACLLGARHRMAVAMLVLAMMLHPLVAAPGFAIFFLWHAWERRRLLWLVPVALASAAILAAAWPGHIVRLDPSWAAVVAERSPHLFLLQWRMADWSRFVWGLCVIGMAVRYLDASARRLAFAVAAIAVTGLAASWVAVDLLGNAFAAGLQFWRAHWLMHFLAIVLVPVAVAGLWRSGNAGRAAAACVAASCCYGRAELPASLLLAVLAAALGASERLRPGWMRERTLRLVLLAVACAASVGLLFEVQARLPSVYGAARLPAWTDYVNAAASVGGLLPLALLAWTAACSRFAVAALAAAAAMFAVSVAAWDAREPWPRFVEEASRETNPFRGNLPPHAVVFWPGPYGKAWFALGRPTWFSEDQGAGVVFNRETAIEYAKRELASRGLRSAIEACATVEQSSCRIDARVARELCDRAGGPDYLVLNARIEGYATVQWPLPPDIGPGRRVLFLYACNDLSGNEKGRR
jgi:hypothetical protein